MSSERLWTLRVTSQEAQGPRLMNHSPPKISTFRDGGKVSYHTMPTVDVMRMSQLLHLSVPTFSPPHAGYAVQTNPF